jgi:hypothetical protein
VKEGDPEGGGGADDGAFGEKVDQQAGSDSDGHGLGGFAAGEGFQVSEQSAQGEAGSGGAGGSIHVFKGDSEPWVKSMG